MNKALTMAVPQMGLNTVVDTKGHAVGPQSEILKAGTKPAEAQRGAETFCSQSYDTKKKEYLFVPDKSLSPRICSKRNESQDLENTQLQRASFG